MGVVEQVGCMVGEQECCKQVAVRTKMVRKSE